MINLANKLNGDEIRVSLNKNRILLYERIKNHQNVSDKGLRRELLASDISFINEIKNEEKELKKQTILQLLKAAEVGNNLSTSIKDYDKLTVNDLLTLAKESLTFISSVTENNPSVSTVIKKFDGIKKGIENDPHWKVLLEQPIN